MNNNDKVDQLVEGMAQAAADIIYASVNALQVNARFEEMKTWNPANRWKVVDILEERLTNFNDDFIKSPKGRKKFLKGIREMEAGAASEDLLSSVQAEAQVLYHVAAIKAGSAAPFTKAFVEEMSAMSDTDYHSLSGQFNAQTRAYDKAMGITPEPAPAAVPGANPFRVKNPMPEVEGAALKRNLPYRPFKF